MSSEAATGPRDRFSRLVKIWFVLTIIVFSAGAALMWFGLETYYSCRVGGVHWTEQAFDSLYRSAQLFTLTFTPPPPPTECALNATPSILFDQEGFPWSPWPLLTLSVAAPLLTLSGLIGLVGSTLDRAGLFWMRRRGNLLVVCGTGERGLALLEQGPDDRLNSVAVSLTGSAAPAVEARGALFVEGDAQDGSVLLRAGVARGWSLNPETSVVITTDDERLSEEIAEEAHRLMRLGSKSGRHANQWVAFHVRSKSRNLEQLSREPLVDAAPFPVDLTLRMGVSVAASKALAGCRADQRVCIVGAKDPDLPVSVAVACSNMPASKLPKVALVLPQESYEDALARLESTKGIELSPAKVDVGSALRDGDDREAEKLLTELCAADVAVVALRDDSLACDLVEMIGENSQLGSIRMVVCVEGSDRAVRRLLDQTPGLGERTEVLKFAEVSSVPKIREEIQDLRRDLAPIAAKLPEQARTGLRLRFQAGARTADDLKVYVDSLCDGVCDRLHRRNWRVASIEDPQTWKEVARALTTAGNESFAFMAWCEWTRALPENDRQTAVDAEHRSLLKDVPTGSAGAKVNDAQTTSTRLLELFRRVAIAAPPAQTSPAVILTGLVGEGDSPRLKELLDGALASKFTINPEVSRGEWLKVEEFEQQFGFKAGFRYVLEADDHAETAVTSPCEEFRDAVQSRQRESDSAQAGTVLQQLLGRWESLLFDDQGALAVSVRSSALLAILLAAKLDGDEHAQTAEAIRAELILARALEVGHIAVCRDDHKYMLLPSDKRGLIELPVDRMTLRAFLGVTSPKEGQSGPLSRGCPMKPEEIDEWAKQLQQNYVDMNAWLKLKKSSDDPAMRGWDELVGFFKESSRSVARDWDNKKSAIGDEKANELADWAYARLDAEQREAATPRDFQEIGGNLTGSTAEMFVLLELLAEMEHGRWNFERISAGWSFGERDVGRKTTAKAKPWTDEDALGSFDNEYRDLDRQQVLRCLTLHIDAAAASR